MPYCVYRLYAAAYVSAKVFPQLSPYRQGNEG
jgi:hypothetical protein